MSLTTEDRFHGSLVASFAAGKTVGVARKATVVMVDVDIPFDAKKVKNDYWPRERLWEALILIANDQDEREAKDNAVVNMSFSLGDYGNPVFYQILTKLMKAMEDKYGVVFVVAAGNTNSARNDANDPNNFISWYPALADTGLAGMIVVGATDEQGFPWAGTSLTPADKPELIWATAPGGDLTVSRDMRKVMGEYIQGAEDKANWPISGTSYATGLVSGLVAYLRASPDYQGQGTPKGIKAAVREMRRPLSFENGGVAGRSSKLVWNGQRGEDTCFPDFSDAGNTGLVARQQACPLPGNPGNPGGTPRGPTVEFRPGPPSPLCTTNCGKLCSGYYCVPNPTGTPPDFLGNPVTTAPGPGVTLGPGFTSFPGFTPGPGETGGPPGEWCLSTSTFKQCNGDPRGGACVTTSSCASWGRPDLPTLTTEPPFSPSGGSCLHSTTWTELGGPKFEATITKSSCDQWSTPAPPTPTPEPPPPPPPPPPPKPRCFTAHLYIRTCAFGDASYVLMAWDNGVEQNCEGRNREPAASDRTVFEYDCDGGGYVAITDFGGNFKEYTAGDGWSIKPRILDSHDTGSDCGRLHGYQYELVYTNGECDNCPEAGLCDYRSYCSDFDGACKS